MNKEKSTNAIEIRKLTKSYGKSRGIDELELVVQSGDFFGFIGPNGAGKSTTIRTLLGLIYPTTGTASVLGYDIVSDKEKILKEVGYLPSEINFYNGMKVKDVIKYSADLRHAKCKEKSDELSERLGLDLNKKVNELSLGNRKKVGIVCAIQHSPKLLILDEPTSGLDPLMQREFFNILKEENESGATIFFSSHILSEVQNYCRSAAFIKDGRIIMSDKVENLEQTGTKKITVIGINDFSRISALQGVTAIDKSDAANSNSVTFSFFYNGDLKPLLNILAAEDMKDITITEPSLEEIFMNYYE
jgi:ABC-type multidrug transport system, ATPase component